MPITDWLWLIRLIIEILKLLADLPQAELRAMANLRGVVDLPGKPAKRSRTAAKGPDEPPSKATA